MHRCRALVGHGKCNCSGIPCWFGSICAKTNVTTPLPDLNAAKLSAFPFPEKSFPSILQEKLASPDEFSDEFSVEEVGEEVLSLFIAALLFPLHEYNNEDAERVISNIFFICFIKFILSKNLFLLNAHLF